MKHFRLDAVNILVTWSAESEPTGLTAVTLAVMETLLEDSSSEKHLDNDTGLIILTPVTTGSRRKTK